MLYILFHLLYLFICLALFAGSHWKKKKGTSFVYRAHGISIILGIFQHSLILIGLAAMVSQSQARQELVMASGGNMSITKRAALCRKRGGEEKKKKCKFTLKTPSGDN